METTQLSVEWVAIGRLYCSPSNPRQNDPAVPHVAASIRRFGWQQPLVARRSGEVIAGNTRLKAAHSLGYREVPVAWFEGSDLDAVAYQIADNRTHEFAEWDDASLARILEQLRAEDSLDGVGFDDAQIDELLAQIEADLAGGEVEDPGPGEPPAEPVSRPGDLWLLGDHRLLCGDSTRTEDLERLMAGAKARLLATDPPYLVDYEQQGWDEFEGAEAGVGFYDAFLRACLPHLEPDAAVYQWHATRRQSLVETAWQQNGLLVHQTLIWVKARGVLGRSLFMWRHEPCFVGWREGHMPSKDRRPPPGQTTVWEIDQAGEERPDHPTPKPLEVFKRPLEYHTRRGEVALELFSGSGSQIIAAEQTGRRCFAMELSPAFVDVAVRRWEQATGSQAVLDGTRETLDRVAAGRSET